MSRVVDEAVFQEGLEFRGAHPRCLGGELVVPDFPMSRIGRVTDFCYADGNYEYTQTFNFCQTKNYSHVFQTSGT